MFVCLVADFDEENVLGKLIFHVFNSGFLFELLARWCHWLLDTYDSFSSENDYIVLKSVHFLYAFRLQDS